MSTDSLSIASFQLGAQDLMNNECANAMADTGLKVRVVSEAPTEMKPEHSETDAINWSEQVNQRLGRGLVPICHTGLSEAKGGSHELFRHPFLIVFAVEHLKWLRTRLKDLRKLMHSLFRAFDAEDPMNQAGFLCQPEALELQIEHLKPCEAL